jgi:hypothetical protein
MIIRTENSVYEVETTEEENDNLFKVTKTESFNPLSVFNEVGQVKYCTSMFLRVDEPATFMERRYIPANDETINAPWHTSKVEAIEI